MNTTDNPLKKLIVSNLYNRYSGILSLSDIPLFLMDTNGEILLELIPFPDFCRYMCMENESKVCPQYKERLDKKLEGSFVCEYGLENISLPIRLENETFGYIAGLQVYTKETEYKKHMINIESLKNKKNADLEFIAKLISALKVADLDKIKVHEQLCQHIAKNISLDLSQTLRSDSPNMTLLSIEKDMLEKKIIDLEAKNNSLVINPHFLFNTLNCIARIAYFEKSHTTEELIYCLSDLLRYNLKQSDQLHTIASEIDNIEKYLYIQKARFKNRIQYTIDVADKIKSFRIPNMVIQPIVENAIVHGITPKRDGGQIHIKGELSNNTILISISDNGNGFNKDAIDKINNSEKISGLGFSCTDKRLKKYYGDSYGLSIEKSDYSGSTVSITIPV